MKEISTKEWWIGLIVMLLSLTVGAVFEPAIKDVLMKEIRTYQHALRVDNDPKTYAYAKLTNVGNVLAFGNITASQPVTIPELKQAYGRIVKIKEHYTRHTRQVCKKYERQKVNGTPSSSETCVKWEQETYYTWDVAGYSHFISAEWQFLDMTFSSAQLEMTEGNLLTLDKNSVNASYDGFYDGWHLYEQSIFGMPTGNDRYFFRVVPISFSCTIFANFVGDTVSDPVSGSKVLHVYDGSTPDQVIQRKKDNLIVFDVAYFSIIVILCVGFWYYLAYDHLDIQ